MAIMSTTAKIKATKIINNQEVPLDTFYVKTDSIKENYVDEGETGNKEE